MAVTAALLWHRLPRWLESRPHRFTVRSEVHGLLEIAITQTTALVEIRDCLREMSKIGYAKQIDAVSVAVIEEIRDEKSCISEFRDLVNARFPTRQDGEKIVGLLGQIRDYAEGLAVISTDIHAVREAVSDEGKEFDAAWKQRATMVEAILREIAESQPKILAQLEQNDKRMFEFVAATKGIMKAMNGEGYEDDDIIVDEARRIKAYAAEQGVELTLEDAIKRARSKRTYARA